MRNIVLGLSPEEFLKLSEMPEIILENMPENTPENM